MLVENSKQVISVASSNYFQVAVIGVLVGIR